MGKIFEFIPGSAIDRVSGAVGTMGASAAFARTEKGLALKSKDEAFYTISFAENDHNVSNLDGDFSVVCWLKRDDTSIDDENPMGSLGASFQPFRIRNARWDYYFSDGGPSGQGIALYPEQGKWYCWIITYELGGNISCYSDGVLVDARAADGSNGITITDLWIGAAASSDFFNGSVGRCIIYDHILTAKERAKLYNEFLNAYPITTTIR